MAAGVGKRLGGSFNILPKCLLEFAGQSLLHRHLKILRHCGITEIVIGVGYRSEQTEAAVAAHQDAAEIDTVYNPHYQQGSMVTLWTLRNHITRGDDLLLMDADVLYDQRMLERLLASAHANCFLMDRDLEPGEEPVKLCVRDGRLVEFRKQVEVDYDYCGESVGFFRFSPIMAQRLIVATERYIDGGFLDEPHEEAIRDILLAEPEAFGFEEVTGLPWIEIDFPEDVIRARDEVLPRLVSLAG